MWASRWASQVGRYRGGVGGVQAAACSGVPCCVHRIPGEQAVLEAFPVHMVCRCFSCRYRSQLGEGATGGCVSQFQLCKLHTQSTPPPLTGLCAGTDVSKEASKMVLVDDNFGEWQLCCADQWLCSSSCMELGAADMPACLPAWLAAVCGTGGLC